MAFRLSSEETVEKGLRRIVSEELECAVSNLRKEDECVGGQGIHEARKSIKKLRAVARLLMPGLGSAGLRENRSLRDTGRALSGLRDAVALIETVESLSEHYFSDPAIEQLSVVRSALRRRLEETVRGEDCKTMLGGAVASLKTVKKRSSKWPIAGGFAAIAPGIEGTYRRGRKRLRVAQAEPTPENLHALRKRVKDHWYHVRLLDGAFGKMTVTGSREKELGKVQDWLGDDHNLTVLSQAINAEPAAFGGKKVVPAVLRLIEKAQKVLRDQALASAAQLFEAKPSAHLRQVGEAWEAWENGSAKSKPPEAVKHNSPRSRGSAA